MALPDWLTTALPWLIPGVAPTKGVETISRFMEDWPELVEEDIVPMIKYRQKLEKDAFDKAYRELLELERE